MTADDRGPSEAFLALATAPARDLRARMRRGTTPDRAVLAGWEYRGINTARALRLAGIDRFVKGFTGSVGYNRRVRRGPRTDPWLRRGQPDPERYAFFAVDDVDPESPDNRYLRSLLLDYGPHATSPVDPAARLRDHLVALDDDHERLLGHAFVAAGSRRVPVTFFVLERLRPVPADEGLSR